MSKIIGRLDNARLTPIRNSIGTQLMMTAKQTATRLTPIRNSIGTQQKGLFVLLSRWLIPTLNSIGTQLSVAIVDNYKQLISIR